MPTAAFQACFTDWRLIKGRKVVQVVLEVPLEGADVAYQALGGMPDPGKSVWVGVARLTGPQAGAVREADNREPSASRKSWHEMTPAQQAGILCDDESFGRYLYEQFPTYRSMSVVDAVRHYCGVKSRKEILPNKEAAERWHSLVKDYRTWMHEPEFVG